MTNDSPAFGALPPEKLDTLLTGYEIKTLVSSSIRGAIYEAQQVSLDRKVTVKVLPPEIGKNSALRAAFEAGAKTMARLNDPNLVDVFDFGNIDGMLFIIMEYVPGRSLHDTTHGKRVDQKESSRLVADICHGLHHAHQEGIIHRALEPKKILINNEAQPKIVDFDLAQILSQQSVNAVNAYAAPETYQAGTPIDHRADIYSVGMILYDLIVGRLPEEPYAAPSTVRNCRPEIDTIIYKAIQPEPEKRYASADKMARDLEEMLEKMGPPPTQKAIKTLVTSGSSTRPRPLARPVAIPHSSSGNSAVIVTFVVIAVVTVIILLVVNSSDEPKETQDTAPEKPEKPVAAKALPSPKKPRSDPKPPRRRPIAARPDIPDEPDRPDEPEPVIEDDDPDTEIADTPEAQPDVPEISEPPKPPEFDREAWLENARAFMRKKASSTLQEYDKALHKNIDSFERDVKRLIRKLDRDDRKPAETKAEQTFITLRELGRLPDEPVKDSPKQVKKIYQEALNDQSKIDQEFLVDFTRLRIFYVQGIDKQISILRKEGNDEHADALVQEIEATQNDMDRFMRILRDQEPDPEPEENEKDKEKE